MLARIALFVFILSWLGRVWAEPFDPWAGPKAVAIYGASDPWNMVMGSDTPDFALYEDGEVIFRQYVKEKHEWIYLHKRLQGAELTSVLQRLQVVWRIKNLKKHYDIAGNITDQPTGTFYFQEKGKVLTTSVYGLGDESPHLPSQDSADISIPPPELLKLHEFVCHPGFENCEPWVSRYIEVMIWDYNYAPDESIHWPKDWPSLSSDRALKRGDSYSIFLDSSELPRLKELLASRKERGALELDGKKWAVSYRFVFPRVEDKPKAKAH